MTDSFKPSEPGGGILNEQTSGRWPAVRNAAEWLDSTHQTNPKIKEIAEQCESLAFDILQIIPGDDEQLVVGLQKLVEAKDAFIRAHLRTQGKAPFSA